MIQWDSWEVARAKINNSFNALVTQFQNSIPYIQNGYWYVNWENTGVAVSWWVPALRVNNGVLQWKVSGSSMEWANLLKLSDLKWDPWEWWIIYGSNITDVETSLDEDRGITYLIIKLDDGTSRTVELFKRTDIYPQRQVATGSVENVSRTFFAKSTDVKDSVNRTAFLVNPDSMEASWEDYTPQYWDTVWVYFQTDCKVEAPTLNIAGTGQKNIQVRNISRNNTDNDYYYNFHVWKETWVPFYYLGGAWYTNFLSQVVDIYADETWWLVDATRELARTRVDVTAEEYLQLVSSWQLKQRVYYHIID